jgi:hypothetical protein
MLIHCYDSNTKESTKVDTAEGTTPATGNQDENLPSAYFR